MQTAPPPKTYRANELAHTQSEWDNYFIKNEEMENGEIIEINYTPANEDTPGATKFRELYPDVDKLREFEPDKKEAIEEIDNAINISPLGTLKQKVQNTTLSDFSRLSDREIQKINGINGLFTSLPKTYQLIQTFNSNNFIKHQIGGKTKRKYRRGKKTRRNKSKTARRNRK